MVEPDALTSDPTESWGYGGGGIGHHLLLRLARGYLESSPEAKVAVRICGQSSLPFSRSK